MAEEDLTVDAENEEAASEEVETEEESKEDRTEQKHTKFRTVGVRRTNAVLDSIPFCGSSAIPQATATRMKKSTRCFPPFRNPLTAPARALRSPKGWRRLTSPSIDSPILTNKKEGRSSLCCVPLLLDALFR